MERHRRAVWLSDPGAVRFLDESHKENPLVGRILDLLLREKRKEKNHHKGLKAEASVVRASQFWFNRHLGCKNAPRLAPPLANEPVSLETVVFVTRDGEPSGVLPRQASASSTRSQE